METTIMLGLYWYTQFFLDDMLESYEHLHPHQTEPRSLFGNSGGSQTSRQGEIRRTYCRGLGFWVLGF